MPTINSTQEAYSAGITLAGHVYSKATVHHFIRSIAIVLAFVVFSYLALVTFPSLAARRYPSPPALRNASTRVIDTDSSEVDISLPERPFRTRPCPSTHLESESSLPLKFVSPPPRPHPQYAIIPRPQTQANSHALSPPVYAALVHLHYAADTLVGAHPFAVSFVSRPIIQSPRKIVFPWVHPDASFGLIRSSGVRTPICAAALNKVKRSDSTASTTSSHSVSASSSAPTSVPSPSVTRNKNRTRDSRLLYNNFGSSSNKVNTRGRSKNLKSTGAGVKSVGGKAVGKNVSAKDAHRVGVIFERRERVREGEKEKENVAPRSAKRV